MSNERKQAIERATELGIVFTNNISTKNLKTLINAKEDELSNDLTPKSEIQKEVIDPKIETPVIKEEIIIDPIENNPLPKIETPTPEENQEESYSDEMVIQRISACGNYRAKIIGAKEAARRSNVTVEEVLTSIKDAMPIKGWTFKEVESE